MSETLTQSPEQKISQEKSKASFVEKLGLKKKHPYEEFNKGMNATPGISGRESTDILFFLDKKPASERSIEELENQKNRLETILNRNDIHQRQRVAFSRQKRAIETVLLYRSNPEYKNLIDKANDLSNKRVAKTRDWEKHIRETEGDEAYYKKWKAGEEPNFFTPEELQLDVDIAKKEAESGLSSIVKWKEEIQKVGGISNWNRNLNKNILLAAKEGIKSGQNTKDNIKDIDRLLQEGGFLEEEKTADK